LFARRVEPAVLEEFLFEQALDLPGFVGQPRADF